MLGAVDETTEHTAVEGEEATGGRGEESGGGAEKIYARVAAPTSIHSTSSRLPALQAHHMSKTPVPRRPSCMLTQRNQQAITVASESSFSAGGRTISDHKDMLKSDTVEALICLQDWLKAADHKPTNKEVEEKEYLVFYQGVMKKLTSLTTKG